MEDNNMSIQEKLVKIQSGEIEYVGDYYINHEHNAHITKLIAIVGRTLVKHKGELNMCLKNYMGYEYVAVTGVGLDNHAVDLLAHACYLSNKAKSLIVNIDIIDYMRLTGLDTNNLSNKSRVMKALDKSCDRMMNTSYKLKKDGVIYGEHIILRHKIDTRNNMLTIIFNDAFNVMQSVDKIIHSYNLEDGNSLKKEFSPIILTALSVNNFKKHALQEISFADLKAVVISQTKKASHLKDNYKLAFKELVDEGLLEHCYFDELPNKQTVVRYKFPKSKSLAARNVNKDPVTIDQDATVVECDSLSPEGVMKAIETTIAGLGVNPEYLDSINKKEGWEAIEWESEETNEKSVSANSTNNDGSNDYDILDDEFPF